MFVFMLKWLGGYPCVLLCCIKIRGRVSGFSQNPTTPPARHELHLQRAAAPTAAQQLPHHLGWVTRNPGRNRNPVPVTPPFRLRHRSKAEPRNPRHRSAVPLSVPFRRSAPFRVTPPLPFRRYAPPHRSATVPLCTVPPFRTVPGYATVPLISGYARPKLSG